MATLTGITITLDGHENFYGLDLTEGSDLPDSVSIAFSGGSAFRGTIAQHERFIDLYTRALDRVRAGRGDDEEGRGACLLCGVWRSAHSADEWQAHRRRHDGLEGVRAGRKRAQTEEAVAIAEASQHGPDYWDALRRQVKTP